MNWQVKSAIQRFCCALPFASDTVYYTLQRRLGSLRNPPPPDALLAAAVDLCQWLRDAGTSIRGRRCFEVGTGRRCDLPFGLYLLGASRVQTFDLNTYWRAELVDYSLDWMRRNRPRVESIFLPGVDDSADFHRRLDALLAARTPSDAMSVAAVEYHAPVDAARTSLPDGSIDFHYSYTVNEHIPGDILEDILRESCRLMAPGGIVLHHVDVSDHFSHDDPSIPAIHFLRFTPQEWERHGANRFAYHNRLRAHEHAAIFERAGLEILRQKTSIDDRSVAELRSGFPLAAEFRNLTEEQVCGTTIRLMGRPRVRQ